MMILKSLASGAAILGLFLVSLVFEDGPEATQAPMRLRRTSTSRSSIRT